MTSPEDEPRASATEPASRSDDPDADPFGDPRGRDDQQWRRVVRRCLAWFEDFATVRVEAGAYWWEGERDYASASLGVHLRWARCPILPTADRWEGVMGISGGRQPTRISVTCFPFERGRRAGTDRTTPIYVRLERTESGGRFVLEPRWVGDEYGEWEGVRRTGDLFSSSPCRVRVFGRLVRIRFNELIRPAAEARVTVALHSVHGGPGEAILDPRGVPWIQESGLVLESPNAKINVARLLQPLGCRAGRVRVVLRIGGLEFGVGEKSELTSPVWIPWAEG